MDDIVAIKVKDKEYGEGGFITWGRIFHTIDDKELLEVIKKYYSRWGKELETIELCYSLGEIAYIPYFYEALIRIIQEPISFGPKYKAWKKKKQKALEEGNEIYFAGFMKNYTDYLERKKLGFPDK